MAVSVVRLDGQDAAAPDPDIRLVDVERVEVLKGPQGALYGSGTLGGTCHIVTRRAKPDETTLTAFAGAEGVAHGGQGWSASAVANLPLAGDAAAIRLVGYGASEAGWIDTGGRADSNRVQVLGARANLGLEPGKGWRVDVSGLLQLLESRDSSYVCAPGARTRPAQLAEPHDNDLRHLSLRVSRQGGGLDLALATGLSWHEVGDELDATQGAAGFGLVAPRLLSGGRVARERHRDGATPSLSLSWQLGAGQLFYLRYASAYRQGGSDITASGAIEALKGDELQTLEAGWRRSLGGDSRLEIGLFASHREIVQSDELETNGIIERRNAGNARILGAEATLDLAAAPGWRLEAGATLTDAALVRNALGRALDDRRLPVVPRLTARLAVTHRFTLGRADLQLRGSLRHVGAQRLSFDPAIDRPMGSYLESRLQAQGSADGYRITLTADNLLGGARNSFAFGHSLRFATTRQFTPQRPASLALSVAHDF